MLASFAALILYMLRVSRFFQFRGFLFFLRYLRKYVRTYFAILISRNNVQSSVPTRFNMESSDKPDTTRPTSSGNDEEFLVVFKDDKDVGNPKAMSTARKWLIVIIVSLSSLCVACTSSLYTGTYAQLREDLGSSRIVSTLGLSMFVIGLAVSPMFTAPLSEVWLHDGQFVSFLKDMPLRTKKLSIQFYGRKPVYMISMFCFVVWIIPCAVAQNIQTLLVSRFFDGFSGSTFLSIAGGTVGDVFSSSDLVAPMMIYTASPL